MKTLMTSTKLLCLVYKTEYGCECSVYVGIFLQRKCGLKHNSGMPGAVSTKLRTVGVVRGRKGVLAVAAASAGARAEIEAGAG